MNDMYSIYAGGKKTTEYGFNFNNSKGHNLYEQKVIKLQSKEASIPIIAKPINDMELQHRSISTTAKITDDTNIRPQYNRL